MSKLKRASKQPAFRTKRATALPRLESLEDRIVPAIDTLSSAAALSLTTNVAIVSGFVENSNDVEMYAVTLNRGDVLHLDVDATSLGSGLDTYLRVFDSSGRQLAANDNFEGVDSALTFQASSTGKYFVGVSAKGNDRYNPAVQPGAARADLWPNRGFFSLNVTRTAAAAPTVADLVGGSFEVVENFADLQDITTPITVRYRVDNRGAAAAGPFTVEFRLTSFFDDRALMVLTTTLPAAQGSIVGGRIQVNGLQAGASFSDEITFTLPGVFPLTAFFVGMRLDSADEVIEGNETNNSHAVSGNRDALNVTVGTGDGPSDGLSVWQDPVDSVAADFNGDGVVDLAYLNREDRGPLVDRNRPRPDTLVIMYGFGDGTFSRVVIDRLTSDATPAGLHRTFDLEMMTTGDFNGDGRADLVIAGPSFAHVFLSNGFGFSNGNFPRFGTTPFLNFGVTGIVVGDFNADGNDDLAVAPAAGSAFSGQLRVYFGWGDGSFASPNGLAVTGTLDGPLVAGDFNRDGRPDLASGSGLVFLGQAGGTFVQSASTFAGGELLVGDFDHDGNLDLAAGTRFSAELFISLGRGDGTFALRPTIVLNGLNNNLATGDYNSDGILDLATANDAGVVSVLLGKGIRGQAAFEPEIRFDAGNNTPLGNNTLTASDLNHDGRIDLALAQLNPISNVQIPTDIQDLRWFFGRGDGTFQSETIARVGKDPVAIARGDFNRDGNVDVVVANQSSNDVSVLISRGDGTFEDGVKYSASGASDQVAVGEFNGDGRLDIAVLADSEVTLYLGLGDGTFQFDSTFTSSASGTMLGADLNGDGLTDLAIGNEVYLAGPDVTFIKVPAVLPGAVSAVGHFNGDLIPDLVVDVNGPVIALGNDDGTRHGDGTFTVVASSFRGNVGDPLTTAADVIGSMGLTLPPLGMVPTADFDGDGILDLVIAAIDPANPFAVQTVALIFRGGSTNGKADGTFTLAVSVIPDAAVGGHRLEAIDLNGDGRADLAVAHRFEVQNPDLDRPSQVLVYLSNGIATSGGNDLQFEGVTLVDTGQFPVVVIGVDLNGDQRPDLVTVDEGPESLSIFLNRGDGEFLSEREFVATTPQARPIVADVDGDGTMDSLVLSQGGEIFFRRGRPGQPGSFDAPMLVNPGQPARDLAVVTQNSNVRLAALDLQPVGDSSPDHIALYDWNAAAKTFSRTEGPATSALPTRILAGDVTGVGSQDLVVLSVGTAQVFASSGSNFVPAGTPVNVGSVPGLFTLANVDGVSGLDLIIGQPDAGEVRIVPITVPGGVPTFGTPLLFRTGAGLYETGSEALARELTWSVQVDDFNRDGLPDLVVTNRNANTFALLLGQGAGTFSEPRVFATGSLPTEIVVGDFDDDDNLDVAVLNEADATVSIFLGDGLGGFFLGSTLSAGNSPSGLSTNDVNQDGNPDLLIGNIFGDLLIILGNGDGTFRPFVRAQQSVPFVTTDIDGDGVADVVLANQSVDQVLSQIRNAGTTSFSLGSFAQSSAQGVQAPGFLTLADINNDTIQDLLVANSGSNNVLVYLGTGPGQFSSTAMSFFTGTNPVGLTVANLNDDTLADVAVVNQGSNDVTVLFGSGAGTGWTLTPGPRLDVGLGPTSITAGNFDSLPGIDLMVTNAQEATMWMVPGLGSGFFDDGNPNILPLPAPITQTIFNNGLGFLLLNTGSIFTFNPLNFGVGTANVYNSPVNIQTNSFTFRPGTTDIFTGRNDGTIAVLTETSGLYADSLIFRDAQLTNPSALQVVGDDIYVTNQGNSIPVVIGLDTLFGTGVGGLGIGDDMFGSVTSLDSIDAARLSVIATSLASSSNTEDDDDETTEDEAGDAFVVGNNVGLIGSVNLLSLLFAQQNGVEDTLDDGDSETEAAVETPEWVEFVVGLQAALDRFRADLRANNAELAGIDVIDHSLGQLGLWLADSARGLDGWLTAVAPPQRAFETALLASRQARQPGSHPATGDLDKEGVETAITTETASRPEPPATLAWWASLHIDWWSALTATTLASCGWLAWRRRSSSKKLVSPPPVP